jgi:hypothetical protein
MTRREVLSVQIVVLVDGLEWRRVVTPSLFEPTAITMNQK